MSLSASRSCSPMHLRYSFRKENASMPKRVWGSCVVILGVLRGSLQMFLVVLMINLSSFLISGMEYGTAWKL